MLSLKPRATDSVHLRSEGENVCKETYVNLFFHQNTYSICNRIYAVYLIAWHQWILRCDSSGGPSKTLSFLTYSQEIVWPVVNLFLSVSCLKMLTFKEGHYSYRVTLTRFSIPWRVLRSDIFTLSSLYLLPAEIYCHPSIYNSNIPSHCAALKTQARCAWLEKNKYTPLYDPVLV